LPPRTSSDIYGAYIADYPITTGSRNLFSTSNSPERANGYFDITNLYGRIFQMRNVSLDEHLEAQAREAEHIEGLRRAMAEMLKAASQQTAAFHPHGSPAARSSQVERRP
jgi:hypothetical protein